MQNISVKSSKKETFPQLWLNSSILPVRCFYCNEFLSRYQLDQNTIDEEKITKFCCKSIVLSTKMSISKRNSTFKEGLKK